MSSFSQLSNLATKAETGPATASNGTDGPSDTSSFTTVSSTLDVDATTTTTTSDSVEQTTFTHAPQSTTRAASEVTSTVTTVQTHSTLTSTITDQPESTFRTPVPITLTSEGKLSTTTPPLITVLSTAVASNGSVVTFTHVIANPTGFTDTAGSSHAFLKNQVQVAGVFLVVGVAATFLFLLTFLSLRRCRRRDINQRRKWLVGMQSPHPPPTNPFERHMVQAVTPNQDSLTWYERRHSFTDVGDASSSGKLGELAESSALGLTVTRGYRKPPFSDLCRIDSVEIPTSKSNMDLRESQRSLQSSPSLYPATLPPNDVALEHEEVEFPSIGQREEPPPRPPRSRLRERASSRSFDTSAMNSPTSVSSHETHHPSNPPSPVTYPRTSPSPSASPLRLQTSEEDSHQWKTLLNVRPRRSQDSFGIKL